MLDPDILVAIYVLGSLIGILILYAIISGASRAKEKVDLAKIQIKLLMSIAIKLGVDVDEVNNDVKSRHDIEKEILTNRKA